MASPFEVKMEKKIMLVGIFALAAIVAIVLVVQNTLTGMVYFAADDYYVRPSGMQMRVESGVMVLQSDVVVNQVCRNAVACDGESRYTCCNHDGTSCIRPDQDDAARGSCPPTHRSRCQCREDYVAGLYERYG